MEIRNNVLISEEQTASLFNKSFLENSENNPTTHLYGLDVEDINTDPNAYIGINCPTSSKYKYVCDDNMDVPIWYKHWK